MVGGSFSCIDDTFEVSSPLSGDGSRDLMGILLILALLHDVPAWSVFCCSTSSLFSSCFG